ncbi:hypothetical protein [Mycetocola saprophilus]|uniref:hypothetical protein n=1 Tax=Mycetocola saprophilus TaxID=76636 RepID=UPI003BF2E039
MNIDWPREFDRQLDRLSADESARGRQVYHLLVFMLKRLGALVTPPEAESPLLKKVKQSRRYLVWRASHPYVPNVAVRVICWFPADHAHVVVALLAGEKSSIGDVFYDSVGIRADRAIEQWRTEMEDQ